MSGASRKEDGVRAMLDFAHPVVPADLVLRATERGVRRRRRRRSARRALWALLVVAVIVFAVWAWVTQPWYTPPSGKTPPLEQF